MFLKIWLIFHLYVTVVKCQEIGIVPIKEEVLTQEVSTQEVSTQEVSTQDIADVDCGGLSNITHGEVSHVSGTIFGMSATYTCTTAGYELIGNMTRMCLEDGSWSGSTPSCKVVGYCGCALP